MFRSNCPAGLSQETYVQALRIVNELRAELGASPLADLPSNEIADGPRLARANDCPLARAVTVAEWRGVAARDRVMVVPATNDPMTDLQAALTSSRWRSRSDPTIAEFILAADGEVFGR